MDTIIIIIILQLILVFKHFQKQYMELEQLVGKEKCILTTEFDDSLFTPETLEDPSKGVAIVCFGMLQYTVPTGNRSTVHVCFRRRSSYYTIFTYSVRRILGTYPPRQFDFKMTIQI